MHACCRCGGAESLDGTTVGFLGYPAHVERRWPTNGRPLSASFAIRRIDQTTGMTEVGSDPHEPRQWIVYREGTGLGSSGGPIFLPNGNVVGIVSRHDQDGSCKAVVHRLSSGATRLPPSPGSTEKYERSVKSHEHWGPDPRLSRFREAVRLVHAADELRRLGKFHRAGELCNLSLELAPDPEYSGAILQRSRVYLYYLATHWNNLSSEARLRYGDWAQKDSYRCLEISPSGTLRGWSIVRILST